VDSANKSIKRAFREYLEAKRPAAVTGEVWRDLLAALAPVSESYLRELVRNASLPFQQPYAGVRQHTLEELAESLLEMLQVYQEAVATGDRKQARYCRRQVIAAKDRAKFLAQNPKTAPEKKQLKEEMVRWMLVWLENPPVFPAWVEARMPLIARPPIRS